MNGAPGGMTNGKGEIAQLVAAEVDDGFGGEEDGAVAPRSGPSVRLTRSMVPACLRMIPCETQRPRPVPRSPLGGEEGLEELAWSSGEIPGPLSMISTMAPASDRRGVSGVRGKTRTMTVPPWPAASAALVMRLVKTWRSSAGNPSTAIPGGRSAETVTPRIWKRRCMSRSRSSSMSLRLTLTGALDSR